MQSYKSIERPAQVLGMNLQDLGLVVGLLIGGILFLSLLSMVATIPRLTYLVVLLGDGGLFFLFRYLAKHRPPGYLFGWISYSFIQPKRISLGSLPPANEKT